MSNEKTTYELVVKKQRIVVSKEVYKAYYECKERERYLEKLHSKHSESLESLVENGFSIEKNSLSISKETAEDKAIENIMIEKLKTILALLEPEERFLISEIYWKGVSERELARRLNVHRKAIYYKREKVIEKIRKIIESKKF